MGTVDRRRALQLAAIAATGGVMLMGGESPRLGWLDEVGAAIESLWAGYGQRDVAATARAAGVQLRSLTAVRMPQISTSSQWDMLAMQGRVGALRARALVDAGDSIAGREAASLAIGRATRAGDHATVVHAYATRAAAELYDRAPGAAIRAVTTGLQISPTDPRLHVAAARAYAQAGLSDLAVDALHRAERTLEQRGAPVVGPAAPGTMSRLEWARAAVDVHARSGSVPQARRIARETVRAVQPELAADVELALGASVAVGLALTDVDEGAEVLSRSLEVSAEMGRPARAVVERVIRFGATAYDPEHPAVRDLLEHLDAVNI